MTSLNHKTIRPSVQQEAHVGLGIIKEKQLICMCVGCGWNKREKVHDVKSLALAIPPGYSTS